MTKHFAATALAGKPVQSFFADTVRLAYHENPGGFLSTGAAWRPSVRTGVFQLANAVFLLATMLVAARLKWSWFATIGLLLFLGGGFSNLIDRVAMGSVIDFLNLGVGSFRTGIFNVADVAIMAGIAILAVEHWRRRSPLAQP